MVFVKGPFLFPLGPFLFAKRNGPIEKRNGPNEKFFKTLTFYIKIAIMTMVVLMFL